MIDRRPRTQRAPALRDSLLLAYALTTPGVAAGAATEIGPWVELPLSVSQQTLDRVLANSAGFIGGGLVVSDINGDLQGGTRKLADGFTIVIEAP